MYSSTTVDTRDLENRSQNLSLYKKLVLTQFDISLDLNSYCLGPLLSHNKFIGTRKFTMRYERFKMNCDFEIFRVDCITLVIKFKDLIISEVRTRLSSTNNSWHWL